MGALTVGRKIIGSFLVVIGLIAVLATIVNLEVGRIQSSYEELIAKNMEKIELVQGIAIDFSNEAVAMRRFNFTGDISDIEIFNDYRKKSDEKIAKLSKDVETEKGKQLLQAMKAEKLMYEAIAEKSFEAKKSNNIEQVAIHMQQAGKPYKATLTYVDECVHTIKGILKNEEKLQEDKANNIKLLLLFFNIIVAIISIAVGLVITRSITKPIWCITNAANELAAGNLKGANIEIKSKDEIGAVANAFNTMKENLTHLIKQIVESAEKVAASSEELTASAEQSAQAANQVASSINEVSAGATEQMNSVNETSAVVEQISARIQQISANAHEVAGQSNQAADKANAGGKAVDKAVIQMKAIEETSRGVSGAITKLNDKSKEIGQIVDAISSIAGQTNLLALNAAIEAARAGEQGRGFAVVAEEVRKLAKNSQESTEKIASLISEIQGDTGNAVRAMELGEREVKLGTEMVSDAGVAFKEIETLVIEVSTQVKSISVEVQQMATDSQQIVGSVKKIDDLSQKSAGEAQSVSAATEEQLASMEEIAASSQSLVELAEGLQSAVEKFKI